MKFPDVTVVEESRRSVKVVSRVDDVRNIAGNAFSILFRIVLLPLSPRRCRKQSTLLFWESSSNPQNSLCSAFWNEQVTSVDMTSLKLNESSTWNVSSLIMPPIFLWI